MMHRRRDCCIALCHRPLSLQLRKRVSEIEVFPFQLIYFLIKFLNLIFLMGYAQLCIATQHRVSPLLFYLPTRRSLRIFHAA